MPNFIVLSLNDPFPISNEEWTQNGWEESIKFNSDHRIVDKDGKTPSLGFTGQRYQIICKIERDFSYLERTKRGFLGTLEIALSLDFSRFSKSAKKLFTKQKENLRFAILMSSEGFDVSEKELQQGISVSEETVSKIQTCMKNIFQEHQDGIRLYDSQARHLVFELDFTPGLLFKIDSYNSMKDRYQNMIYAQTVIRTHHLGLLVIPKAKLFSVTIEDEKYEIIAEQKIDINPHESAQEEYFLDYADSLNETIRQLALFICKTGYSDVAWGNNPILNNSLDEKGNRKIALIDLEEINSPEVGLFGKENMRRGLLGCVNEKQAKMIETVAKENDISTSFFEDAYSQRKKELKEGRKLKEFYAKKGIIKGNEPIEVDERNLSFSTDPETEKKLKELTLDLIQAINTVIAKDSLGRAIKERRLISINTNCEQIQSASNTLIHPDKKTDDDTTFLEGAIKKLKELGVIYGAKLNDSECYFQA